MLSIEIIIGTDKSNEFLNLTENTQNCQINTSIKRHKAQKDFLHSFQSQTIFLALFYPNTPPPSVSTNLDLFFTQFIDKPLKQIEC